MEIIRSFSSVDYTTMYLFLPQPFPELKPRDFSMFSEECVTKAVFMLRDFINITSQAVVPRDYHGAEQDGANEPVFLCVIGPNSHQAET